MGKAIGFKCVECGAELELSETRYQCIKCNGNLQLVYDYDAIKKSWNRSDLENNKDRSIWRYKPLYPVESTIAKPFIGGTPLYFVDKLANDIGLKNLYLKDDG